MLTKQRCWWPDCTLCCVKSCLMFHQPRISSSSRHHLPILSNATGYELCTRFTSTVSSLILSSLPQCKRAINLRADLHHSLPPSTHHCQPHWALTQALICSCYLQRKAEMGITLHCKSRAFWCRAGLSAKHTSMPCSHERGWWNKLDIWARMGNFYLFSPAYMLNSFQGDFSNCIEILHG